MTDTIALWFARFTAGDIGFDNGLHLHEAILVRFICVGLFVAVPLFLIYLMVKHIPPTKGKMNPPKRDSTLR